MFMTIRTKRPSVATAAWAKTSRNFSTTTTRLLALSTFATSRRIRVKSARIGNFIAVRVFLTLSASIYGVLVFVRPHACLRRNSHRTVEFNLWLVLVNTCSSMNVQFSLRSLNGIHRRNTKFAFFDSPLLPLYSHALHYWPIMSQALPCDARYCVNLTLCPSPTHWSCYIIHVHCQISERGNM